MIQSIILAQLQTYQHQFPSAQRWLVALSGGIDSTVLLHAVVSANRQLETPLPVIAIHINHQLSTQALDWQEHCKRYAHTVGVEYIHETVDVARDGKGVEAAARDARYRVFESYIQPGDCLLLGHHQQDQAETLLLRLLRGAGVRGLAAMPRSRAIGEGQLLRPLLDVAQADIEAYADEHKLQWVDDPSNASNDYDRNLLRNQVLPQLRERWPSADKTLAQTSERMQQTEQLCRELAEQDLASLGLCAARWGQCIDFKSLQQLSFVRITNLLQYWCRQSGLPVPEGEHLEQIQQQFFSAQARLSSACVSWSRTQLRQFSGRLYLMPELPAFQTNTQPANNEVPWHTDSILDLHGAGSLRAERLMAKTGDLPAATSKHVCLAPGNYSIRWRQGGERCTPSGRAHSQTVKKLLQEYQLETWLRDRVPLIYRDDTLVAVGDLWSNEAAPLEEQAEVMDVVIVHWDL